MCSHYVRIDIHQCARYKYSFVRPIMKSMTTPMCISGDLKLGHFVDLCLCRQNILLAKCLLVSCDGITARFQSRLQRRQPNGMRSLPCVRTTESSRPSAAAAAIVVGLAHGEEVELSKGGKCVIDYNNVNLYLGESRICQCRDSLD